ncbi:hypothetical protein SDC9_172410 [bioreactor metagenome]|uniref:Uncharacterized protein n=1 Tax=bioreactor metagenome TaxID=1076179 RepID=A0A645GMR9_9ZZZZ|nr:hypothetical protein [Oscillospiraceae bacterium]
MTFQEANKKFCELVEEAASKGVDFNEFTTQALNLYGDVFDEFFNGGVPHSAVPFIAYVLNDFINGLTSIDPAGKLRFECLKATVHSQSIVIPFEVKRNGNKI